MTQLDSGFQSEEAFTKVFFLLEEDDLPLIPMLMCSIFLLITAIALLTSLTLHLCLPKLEVLYDLSHKTFIFAHCLSRFIGL